MQRDPVELCHRTATMVTHIPTGGSNFAIGGNRTASGRDAVVDFVYS